MIESAMIVYSVENTLFAYLTFEIFKCSFGICVVIIVLIFSVYFNGVEYTIAVDDGYGDIGIIVEFVAFGCSASSLNLTKFIIDANVFGIQSHLRIAADEFVLADSGFGETFNLPKAAGTIVNIGVDAT